MLSSNSSASAPKPISALPVRTGQVADHKKDLVS